MAHILVDCNFVKQMHKYMLCFVNWNYTELLNEKLIPILSGRNKGQKSVGHFFLKIGHFVGYY